MDQTTDTLVLDTAWEIHEDGQRFEQQAQPVQLQASMMQPLPKRAQPQPPVQRKPATLWSSLEATAHDLMLRLTSAWRRPH